MKKIIWLVLSGMLLVGMVGCDSDSDTESSTTSEVTPSTQNVEESKEVEDNVPMEYKQALKSAQNYIDVMAFSKQGLYD